MGAEPILVLSLGVALGGLVAHALSRYCAYAPYTPTLVVVGVLGGVAKHLALSPHTSPHLFASLEAWENIEGHTLLQIFLPPLLFVDTIHVSYVLPYRWDWKLALAFGSVLAATDPIAVVASLHELEASPVLTMIIAGESMLNDGSAIVIWELFFGMHMQEVSPKACPHNLASCEGLWLPPTRKSSCRQNSTTRGQSEHPPRPSYSGTRFARSATSSARARRHRRRDSLWNPDALLDLPDEPSARTAGLPDPVCHHDLGGVSLLLPVRRGDWRLSRTGGGVRRHRVICVHVAAPPRPQGTRALLADHRVVDKHNAVPPGWPHHRWPMSGADQAAVE
mmetsp:Transcript_18124/g.54684  ORF Transcript_18124/g.54684 Transcript_18124/m.54684 type:complete len:336 (-) Transcript_18124:610-1617(-)